MKNLYTEEKIKSHSLNLIKEASELLYDYLLVAEGNFSNEFLERKNKRLGYFLNKIFKRMGFHIMRNMYYNQWIKFNADPHGKLICLATITSILSHFEEWDRAFDFLNDDKSKRLYDWFIKFRFAYAFIGEAASEIFEPPISLKEYNGKLEQMKKRKGNNLYIVDNFQIDSDINILVDVFVFEEYRYGNSISPQANNIVLDIGAYKGETAIWFSKYIGAKGEVYAFEPSNKSYDCLLKNINRNKLENIIIPQKIAIYKNSGNMGFFDNGEAGDSLGEDSKNFIPTISIDDFMNKNSLGRVDFIKMDIEGSELEALQGGINTIKKYKPTLAIAVYHKPDDLIKILEFLHFSVPEYKFYLSHKSPFWTDTVLFATPA